MQLALVKASAGIDSEYDQNHSAQNKSGDDKQMEMTQKKAGISPGLDKAKCNLTYEHPLVEPHVSHFKHVPLRTMV